MYDFFVYFTQIRTPFFYTCFFADFLDFLRPLSPFRHQLYPKTLISSDISLKFTFFYIFTNCTLERFLPSKISPSQHKRCIFLFVRTPDTVLGILFLNYSPAHSRGISNRTARNIMQEYYSYVKRQPRPQNETSAAKSSTFMRFYKIISKIRLRSPPRLLFR